MGVAIGDEAAAYPVAILEWHELVNDTLGGRPILISYCPLCGTAMVFDRRINGRARSFGVSELLYRSDLLLYDRHPVTTVLSPKTGHRRAYDRSPYGEYATSEKIRFPAPIDRRYHPKTPTLGLRLAQGPARAYPAIELVRAGGKVEERFAEREVSVTYDPENESFSAKAPPDVEIIEGYWFAWMAFHPQSSVFSAGASGGQLGRWRPVVGIRSPRSR